MTNCGSARGRDSHRGETKRPCRADEGARRCRTSAWASSPPPWGGPSGQPFLSLPSSHHSMEVVIMYLERFPLSIRKTLRLLPWAKY